MLWGEQGGGPTACEGTTSQLRAFWRAVSRFISITAPAQVDGAYRCPCRVPAFPPATDHRWPDVGWRLNLMPLDVLQRDMWRGEPVQQADCIRLWKTVGDRERAASASCGWCS